MASKTPHSDGIVELCDNCGRETAHDVSIQLLTESDDSENAAYSREPYRVTECRACGDESRQRMNNA
ncbi:hypothetical protein [Halospeciosus flavus]|uniref:DUF7835 domain-containing protein n=1 Tax=Halospeciosus flavus TaxID=3032283 RepID=A0ABD5Z1F8_9EURY|nr:hypothetical protein [Halospeciosus flavus]